MIELFEDFGSYTSGFFKIEIDKELYEGIDLNAFNKEEWATFVHEYIHFLQDISTTRGASTFCYLSKMLQLYLSKAAHDDKEIILPLDLEQCGVQNAYEQQELMSFYAGDSGFKKIHHIDSIKREPDEIINSEISDIGKLFSINIYFDGKDLPYLFGANCIAESMAYLIEHTLFGAATRTNEFPYNSCEMIYKYLCPELAERKDILVAICELSLMHYHSGDMFWHILNHIKNEHLRFSSIQDIKEYFSNRTDFLNEDFENILHENEETIDILYPPQISATKQCNAAVKSYIKKGFKKRNEDTFFIARIFESSDPNEFFIELLKIFGIPILCDSKHQVFSSEINLIMMLAPLAILNTFTCMGKNECLMLPFCNEQKLQLVNETCIHAPWKQALRKELCPFAVYWYHYSLSGKKVIKR